jgi:hypothetical protein
MVGKNGVDRYAVWILPGFVLGDYAHLFETRHARWDRPRIRVSRSTRLLPVSPSMPREMRFRWQIFLQWQHHPKGIDSHSIDNFMREPILVYSMSSA